MPVPPARLMAVVLSLLVALAGCADPPPADAAPIRIGAGSTTEQQVLAAITAEQLARGDVPVEIVPDLGDTTDVREDALAGRIDVYWDYSGAAWALSLGLTAPPIDPRASYEAVAAEEESNGLRWIARSGADARLAFFVDADDLQPGEDATLSWLAGRLGPADEALCADEGYLSAQSGYAYLVDTYAIAADDVATRPAGEEAALQATADGECLTGLAPATSGIARDRGLVPLGDDQGVFPALVVAPVVPIDGPADRSEVVDMLEGLAGSLTTDVLAGLNAQAVAGTPIDQVAATYLDGLGAAGG